MRLLSDVPTPVSSPPRQEPDLQTGTQARPPPQPQLPPAALEHSRSVGFHTPVL